MTEEDIYAKTILAILEDKIVVEQYINKVDQHLLNSIKNENIPVEYSARDIARSAATFFINDNSRFFLNDVTSNIIAYGVGAFDHTPEIASVVRKVENIFRVFVIQKELDCLMQRLHYATIEIVIED